MPHSPVHLPTALVARYRAVDREVVGSALVDTPRHLDALTADIGTHGILVPLRLGFNEEFATLDGNHRIAVAIRLGLAEVPVALAAEPLPPRPGHARPMLPEDRAPRRGWPPSTRRRRRRPRASARGPTRRTPASWRPVPAYAPETYRRLGEVKARYDPDNLFRFNHNIPAAR
ncbi:BBE domain-containing protein [Streptomyces sp. PA03-1a]|nr:BBE domain-containing protein [Streptomyces sp. PA03-1a]